MLRLTTRLAAAIPLVAGCATAQAPASADPVATTVTSPAPTASQPAAPPTLVVFVVVDQLRADYYTRFQRNLTGGLRRLYEGGAVFTNAHQDHAITETAPGHSTPLSGRFPRSTGILSNAEGVEGSESKLLDAAGVTPRNGATPLRFRGTALYDWMKAKDARTRVLSVSRKDRGAILPIGRAIAPVYWYDGVAGGFTTSTYYAERLPDWVQQFNTRQPASQYAGRVWDLLLAPTAYPEPDSVPQESFGRGYTFPHVLPDDGALAARSLAATPFMDEYTLAFALQGMQELQLGTGPQSDLLAISLSTTDAIGHAYGPDSREIHDQVVRLDRMLGTFLDSLYRLRDSSRVIVALTSDHGVGALAGYRSHDGSRGEGPVTAFYDSASAVFTRLFRAGVDTSAFILDTPYLILDRPKFARTRVSADSVARDFVRSVRNTAGVLRADLMRDIRRANPERDKIARRWQHMFPDDVPVDVVVTLRPNWTWYRAAATHGLPHDHDTHVPVIFYGAPFRAGQYEAFTRTVDMAPTLAQVLGVTPGEKLDGHVLTTAIR